MHGKRITLTQSGRNPFIFSPGTLRPRVTLRVIRGWPYRQPALPFRSNPLYATHRLCAPFCTLARFSFATLFCTLNSRRYQSNDPARGGSRFVGTLTRADTRSKTPWGRVKKKSRVWKFQSPRFVGKSEANLFRQIERQLSLRRRSREKHEIYVFYPRGPASRPVSSSTAF